MSKKMKAFKDLKYRFWIWMTLAATALVLILFSGHPIAQFCLAAVLTLVVLTGVYEWFGIMEKKKLMIHRRLMVGFASIWMLTSYLSVLGYQVDTFNMLLVGLFCFFLCTSSFRNVHNALVSIATNIMGVVFVVVPLSLILSIVYPDSIGFSGDGRVWLAYLLVVTKITDIGGYFIGKMWGKNKLAPHLSPKKTIEGAVGGLVLSTCASVLFYFVGWIPGFFFDLTLPQSISLGFLLGIVGQFGDLAESLFKRDAQIKDSNAIPGLGGILDMFDSLIFTTPALFLFMKII